MAALVVSFALGGSALAQNSNDSASTPDQKTADQKAGDASTTGAAQNGDPLKRKVDEKRKKTQSKELRGELERSYRKWLDEDVRWIITDQERDAFKRLSNDEERDRFIETFWQRRNPNPDSEENEYKEEHYRRIAYANEHFAAGIAGWRTDRGRIYIMYGPPDEIESHPAGGMYERPMDEGGGETTTYPWEDWRYRYLDNMPGTQKQQVIIEFVDTCMCGEYHMTMDKGEKDALQKVPGAGLTMWEEMGQASKADRVNNGTQTLGLGPEATMLQNKEFDQLAQFANLSRAPEVKFKDLEEVVTSKISYNVMPFEVQTDFIKVTSDTVLVPVTVQMKNKDITFNAKDGVSHGVVHILGRVTTLTDKIVQTFEDTVTADIPSELVAKTAENSQLYWKALPLKPGLYRLDVALKDVNGDRVGKWSRSIKVPYYDEDKLAFSSLIVADQMEKVPTTHVGAGNFVIGTTKVRPRMGGADGKTPPVFKREQKANFWMQVYGLSMDQQSKKPSATIQYDIVNVASKKAVVHLTETTAQLGNVGEQITLEKSLPLASLEPGQYEITIKVNDNVSKQEIAPTAKFAVE